MIKRLINKYRIYKTTLNELNALTDRELADIGIHRVDIKNIAIETAKEKENGTV